MSRARPSTARPTRTLAEEEDGNEAAATAPAAPHSVSARRPASAAVHRPAPPAAPPAASALFRRSAYSPAAADSDSEEDSYPRGRSSYASTRPASSRSVRSGSSSSRPLSAHLSPEISSVVDDLRASSGQRYLEFLPPPSPFTVAPPQASAHAAAAVRGLYRIVDGQCVLRPSRPASSLAGDASATAALPPANPPVPPIPAFASAQRAASDRSASSADSAARAASSPSAAAPAASSGLPPRHYDRPSMSHNFTDGTLKAASSVAASPPLPADDEDLGVDLFGVPILRKPKMKFGEQSDDAELTFEERRAKAKASEAAQAEAQRKKDAEAAALAASRRHAERSASPSSRAAPDSARNGSRSARSSRPGSHRSHSRPSTARPTYPGVHDPPSRERDALWTKGRADAEEARARQQAEMSQTRALDEALQLTVEPKALHEPTAANHALLGMRLVSEDGFAELENARHDSEEEGPLPEGAREKLHHASLHPEAGLSEDDEPNSDEDSQQLASRSAQREREEESTAARTHANLADPGRIDFHRVGVEVAARLAQQGHPLSAHHLDILHSLPLLERVWLACHSSRAHAGGVRGGLTESQFVDFLSAASAMNPPTLSVLFAKIDVHSQASLKWDAYLSYLVREMSQKWNMNAGAGTYIVRQDLRALGALRSETATTIKQLLILPAQGSSALFPTTSSKIIARVGNHTIQVFDTRSLKYLYHLPLHMQPKQRRNKTWDEEEQEIEATQKRKAVAAAVASTSETVKASHHPSAEQTVPLYSAQTGHRSSVNPAVLERLAANDWATDGRAEVRAIHAQAAGREQERQNQKAKEDAAAEAATEAETTSRRSSIIRRIGKSSTPRPMSARPASAVSSNADASASRPISAARTPRPPSAAVKSNYQRKLDSYLQSIEFVSAVPIAQPLACVGQRQDTGRPPVAERATSGGYLHRQTVELEKRNEPYAFPLTAIASYPALKQIVVAAQDRSIRSFGLVRRQYELQECFFVHETPRALLVDTLTALDFHGQHGHADRSLAIVGGLHGSISAYSPSTHARLFHLAHVHAEQSVQKLALFPHVGLISAGMDGRLAVIDPTTFVVQRYLGAGLRSDSMDPESRVTNLHAQASKGHSAGVFSFACAFGSRSLLSVGFDREVFSWDPRLSAPTWKLPTQGSDLLDVLVNEAKNQCIVVCRDSKIRVYDSRTFKLVQETMDAAAAGAAGAAAGTTTACAFDEQRTEMITATDRITRWCVEPSIQNKAALSSGPPATVIAAAAAAGGDPEKAFVRQTQLVALHASQKAHIGSIIAVLYSVTFRQVVTVCANESIRVWSLFSGCRGPVFEFNSTHRAQLTAATLDAQGKRLLTACHHGRVLLWNHNNGELIWSFAPLEGFPRIEVNRLALLTTASQCLVGSGWSKNLFRWAAPLPVSPSSSTVATARPSEAPGHQSQILSLAAFGNFVVTGDARGELISWAADSGHRLQSLMLPASSQELKVHRDLRSGDGRDAMRGPIQRAACAPAVTSLAFFLLHDVEGFDRWNAAAAAVRSNPSSSAAVDYRTQALHTHRACLFVGTDDGSVHLVAPQSLTLLHSALHLLPDTIAAVAVVQTIREEEIDRERPLAAASRRASVRRASVVEQQNDAAAAVAASSAASDAATLAKPVHHRADSSHSGAAAAPAAKIHNPFATQKKIQFRAPPPVAKQTEVEAVPAVSEQQSADDELAAAVAEMAGLDEFSRPDRGTKQPPPNPLLSPSSRGVRLPFTSRLEFKPSVLPASDVAWVVAEPEANAQAEANSLEEYLAMREAKKRKAAAAEAKATQQPREETKEAEDGDGGGADTFLTETALEASSVSHAPKLQLQLAPEPASKPAVQRQVRRIIETRMLVSDSMAGNDAALYSIDLLPSLRASTNEAHRSTISASLVDFDFEVTHLKSMFLFAPPTPPAASTAADGEEKQPEPLLRPLLEDATTDLSVVQQPALGCTVFLAASSEGRACLWTPEGEWIAEFGQAAAKGWPLSVPQGSALQHVQEAAIASPKWGGSRADAAASADGGAKGKAFSFEGEDEDAAEEAPEAAAPQHDADSDRWSSDGSDAALDSEEEAELLRLQVAALGFAPDDSSITAMLASARKSKIMNEDGKKGMAMGPAFAAQEAKRRADQKAADAAAAAAAEAAGRSAVTTARTRPSSPRSQAREDRRRARLARLLSGLKERYASSFALLHARPRPADASLAILPASADSATVVGHSAAFFSSKAFSEAHPQYVPETLRPGGLRSALFLNDAKLRMGKTHEQVKEALAQREAARAKEEQRRLAEAAALGIELAPLAPAESYIDDYSFRAGAKDLNFFQLAPREQRAAAIAQAERDKAVNALPRFLADRSNIVDPSSGLVRNHGVARLAVLLENQEIEAARNRERALKMARPLHVRAASRAVRMAAKKKTNVWLRLAGTEAAATAATAATAGTAAAGPATGRLTPRRPGTASTGRSAAGSAASSRPHSARPSAAQPFSLLVHPAYVALRDQQSKTQVLLPQHANARMEQHAMQLKTSQILQATARSH